MFLQQKPFIAVLAELVVEDLELGVAPGSFGDCRVQVVDVSGVV